MLVEFALKNSMSSLRNDQHAKWWNFVQDIKEKRTRKPMNTSGKQKINK